MERNASLHPEPANAVVKKAQHGTAGVDDVRGEGGIGIEQAGQKASIAVSQHQCVACTGQVCELGIPAPAKPGSKAQIFKPSIGPGDAIEVYAHRAKGKKANGVSNAASAAMRKCSGDRWVLRASRAKSNPLLSRAAR